MKKLIISLGVVCITIFNINALDNVHFNIAGNEYAAGIAARVDVSGLRMLESVYHNPSSDKLLSEIDWNIGLYAAAGAGLCAGPTDPFKKIGFSLEGMAFWHFPVNDRAMKDTDWDDTGNVFNYGESIVSTIAGMEGEGRLAAHFPLRNRFIIEVLAEVWYGRYAAIAHNGWVTQEGYTDKIILYGAAIDYVQEWIVCAPGIGVRCKWNKVHFGVRAALSPFIRGYHIDNHYFRTLEADDPEQKYMSFTDRTRGGIYCNAEGDCWLRITKYTQAGLSVHYRAIEQSRGDTTISTTGRAGYSFVEKGTAGAAMRTMGVGLMIRTAL